MYSETRMVLRYINTKLELHQPLFISISSLLFRAILNFHNHVCALGNRLLQKQILAIRLVSKNKASRYLIYRQASFHIH